jgi:hypothetical protein
MDTRKIEEPVMTHLTRDDLWSLEEYATRRADFRAEVMAHKKNRQLSLGEHARLYFEDATTIRYQIQEMLRIERVFEAEGIEEELSAYNPLIPDGHNWKATFMIEIPDPAQRAVRLGEMIGIEDQVWLQVADMDRIVPIADEDLDRTTADKTASVHFLRFEVTPEQINALKDGATLYAGIDHPSYPLDRYEVPSAVRDSLVADLVVTEH